MDAFSQVEGDIMAKVALAVQGFLIIFFVVSPMLGKVLHNLIAKASSLVLVVCTMLLLGNLIYMGMIYALYPMLPEDAIHPLAWIVLSFSAAFSASMLVGRYMNWFLSDNIQPGIWAEEFDNLTEEDMLPFDRLRKQEMERRKRLKS